MYLWKDSLSSRSGIVRAMREVAQPVSRIGAEERRQNEVGEALRSVRLRGLLHTKALNHYSSSIATSLS